MPKRQKHSDEDIEAYVNRKIRKIEKRLKKRHRQRSSSQDSKIRNESLRSNDYESRSQSPELPLQSIENTQHDTDFHIEEMHPLNVRVNTLLESADGAPSVNVSSEPVAPDTATADAQEVVVNNEAEESLPDDILEILGEAPLRDKRFGPALNSSIAVRWEHTATNGLSKDVKKDIFSKHDIPENCKNINAPLLNQEVRAALTEALSKKDKAIENKQKQIALIIACLGEALSQVLSTDSTNIKLVKSLTEAGKLACDLQHTESMIRRSFVCSSIKKEIKDHLYTTPIDSHLFGSQLGDVLKAAKAIHKTGAEMKTGAPIPGPPRRFTNQSQNLNTRRPLPPPGRQTGAAARHSTVPAQNARHNYQRQQRRAPPLQQQPRGPYKRSQTQASLRR